jgi:hypothetical protein
MLHHHGGSPDSYYTQQDIAVPAEHWQRHERPWLLCMFLCHTTANGHMQAAIMRPLHIITYQEPVQEAQVLLAFDF